METRLKEALSPALGRGAVAHSGLCKNYSFEIAEIDRSFANRNEKAVG